jgi:Family of unknown function (DUF5678)
MEWLRVHSKEFGGQWVALDGDRLIAHGPDAMEVYAAAEADGAYLPMINYIEPADALPFVFWMTTPFELWHLMGDVGLCKRSKTHTHKQRSKIFAGLQPV